MKESHEALFTEHGLRKKTNSLPCFLNETEPSNETPAYPLSPQTGTHVFPPNVTQHNEIEPSSEMSSNEKLDDKTDTKPSNETSSKPNQAEEKISRKVRESEHVTLIFCLAQTMFLNFVCY
ncbi:unnamed protein product [Brassica oleracea var. botrytis]|uniref:(rape) hypothetical protein n=2 Tax=Brassica napus TaxID=3708 RepID=A0A816IK86_BRANA|nr:unnamed protein product [Brassica napus]